MWRTLDRFDWTIGLAGFLLALFVVFFNPTGKAGVVDVKPGNRITVPQTITGTTPRQVCENADAKGKAESLRGWQYTAVWRGYRLTWTEGDPLFGFFFGTAADYLPIDEKTVACLMKAPEGLPH